MSEKQLNRRELAIRFPEAEWREKFLDLLALVSILRDCIIERSYKPSEELAAAIVLNESGKKLQLQLAGKEGVNPKDAKVLTFLALVYVEPFVDIANIDIDRLASAISEELKGGAIRHPFIFGRLLYDRSSELFKEERRYLSHEDTLRLLDGLPQGVFQAGRFLIGPFGIVRVDHKRSLSPTTSVPLQHCADVGCASVHRVQLTTSIEAGVNQSRPALNKVLEQINDEPSEWNGFVTDITEETMSPYETDSGATLAELLGDSFSDDELRTIVVLAETLYRTEYVRQARSLGVAGDAATYTISMQRSQLLQLLFLLDDRSLVDVLDRAVRGGDVIIPKGEVRVSRVNGAVRVGAWRLRSEVSWLGVRAVSTDSTFPLMRLSALARELFDVASNDEMEDLSWLLRGINGDTAHERLEEFLRTSTPPEIVESLVLQRRQTASMVCQRLGISLDQDRMVLRDSILWKLGFRVERSQDVRDHYWSLHTGLESLAKTAEVDLSTTAEGLRAASSNYFVALEQFLFDSLAFATWGLLYDHYASDRPFVHFEDRAREFAVSSLNSWAPDPSRDRDALSDKPQLGQLVQGFTRLSKGLRDITQDASGYERDANSYPRFAAKTSLQRFPFLHTRPFLDLLPESQFSIVETLGLVAAGLGDSGIMTVRNNLLHASSKVPTVRELTDALSRARIALDLLESIGCSRITFEKASSESDKWGRSTQTLRSNGRVITFSSPSPYEWVKIPGLSVPRYLMQGAIFAAPNEMLRFSEGFQSAYREYWADFPVRPERGNGVSADQSETLAVAVETGSFTASRAG